MGEGNQEFPSWAGSPCDTKFISTTRLKPHAHDIAAIRTLSCSLIFIRNLFLLPISSKITCGVVYRFWWNMICAAGGIYMRGSGSTKGMRWENIWGRIQFCDEKIPFDDEKCGKFARLHTVNDEERDLKDKVQCGSTINNIKHNHNNDSDLLLLTILSFTFGSTWKYVCYWSCWQVFQLYLIVIDWNTCCW